MAVVNGKHYANPANGRSLERSRIADSFRGLATQMDGKAGSWVGRLVDHLTTPRAATAPPPSPKPPGMPPQAYDDMKINKLTVRQVANVVANENHDVTPGKSSAEQLQNARIAQAHAVINADRMYGSQRKAAVHTASDEVSPALENSAQYQQALESARTAFQQQLSGYDPVGGRVYFNNRSNASTGTRLIGNERATIFHMFGPFEYGKQTKYIDVYNNVKDMPRPKTKR